MDHLQFNKGVIRPIECYTEAWEMVKSDYWILFAVSLVGILIGVFSMYILLGAMVCGIFICYISKIDRGSVSFDDLWKGFGFFVPSLIVVLLLIVPTLILYAFIYAPILVAALMGQNLSSGEFTVLIIGALSVDLLLIILMVCFHTLLLFSFPLIVDRNLSAFQAMKLSASAVWNNLGGVAGMLGIQFVASIVITILTCGIGAYFAMPILFGGMVVAYRKMFPSLNPRDFSPPSPDKFANAGTFN